MLKVQGFTEKGNTIVYTGGLSSTTRVQGSYPSCLVTVYFSGTTEKPSLYSDNSNPPTAKANPFTASAGGTWDFFVLPGVYDIVFSGGGLPAPFTISSIQVGSGTNFNIADFGGRPDWNGTTGTDIKPLHDNMMEQVRDAGGGNVIYPGGNGGYWFNGDMEFDQCSGVNYVGLGIHQYNLDAEVPTKARIVFTDPDHGVRVTNCFGFNSQGLQVDGTGVVLNAIILDRCYLGICQNTSVYRTHPTDGIAFQGTDTIGTPGTGMNWQRLIGFNAAHVGVGLYFNGIRPITGCFHDTVLGYSINYAGLAGVVFRECDNVGLLEGYFYRTSGAGPFFRYLKDTGYEVNNIFIDHFTGGGNSLPVPMWSIDAGIQNPGVINNADRSNGGLPIAIADNCNLVVRIVGTSDTEGSREPFRYRSGALTRNNGTFGEFIEDNDELGWADIHAVSGFGWGEKNDHLNFLRKFFLNPDGSGYVNIAKWGEVLQLIGGIAPGTIAGAFQSGLPGQIRMDDGDPVGGAQGWLYIKRNGTQAGKDIIWFNQLGVWKKVVP